MSKNSTTRELSMDKDQLKIFVKNVDSQLFEIVNNVICSICQEIFNKPVTTPCAHSFCNGCIKRVLSSKDNSGCPLCKNAVNRYGLKADKVKSTITNICQELPTAFEQDVKELTKSFSDLGEDLIRTSKISHLSNQDTKDSDKGKPKRKIKKGNESKLTDNDSFVPVVKRTKNVSEYVNAKKKKVDDLISVSQTEAASNSSISDLSGLDKKLENIEKIPADKKVNEWFSAVGDNIFINSPNSIIESNSKNECVSEQKEENKSSMIRRDYYKSELSPQIQADASKWLDPYEFIPSQNNNVPKKKQQKKSTVKKIPDFKALQSFSKESLKRSTLFLNDSKEEVSGEEEVKEITVDKQFTASQKFDQLLSETKSDLKKSHVLYSASQASSTQFLDVSFHSKTKSAKRKTPKGQKEEDNYLYRTVELFSDETERKNIRVKRKRSAETPRSGKKKKLFDEVKNDQLPTTENSVEKYLINKPKIPTPSKTKLETLLKELLDDDVIYASRPKNAPIRLPELNVGDCYASCENLQASEIASQNTQLIGFCTQEETPDELKFKAMVENMEQELKSSEYLMMELQQTVPIAEHSPIIANQYLDRTESIPEETPMNDSPVEVNFKIIENAELESRGNLTEPVQKLLSNCESPEPSPKQEYDKINYFIDRNDNCYCRSVEPIYKHITKRVVDFLHLGKLTPIPKRSKTSVVKLVFPIGLTSLARRHASEGINAVALQDTKKQICQVSTGIQASQQAVSCLVQTSQVPQLSVNLQTSQAMGASVEVQTTQKFTASAGIQTSQRLISQEIQTTQIGCESAQAQTKQPEFIYSPRPKPKCLETPIRKPSHQHRKIIENNNSKEKVSGSQLHTPEKQSPVDNDLIMDFGTEKESEEIWRTSANHEDLVEIKNKKNKEQNKKLRNRKSSESDDSDLQPPKRRSSRRVFLQDSQDGILENYETRQYVPLDVRKLNDDVDDDDDVEVIDLDTPKTQNTEDQIFRVLKNIDLDLPKNEKSEESDSDFFVEQTPPRSDKKNSSKSRYTQKLSQFKEIENERQENSEGTDLIGDSLPKGFSESFFHSSVPPKKLTVPDNTSKTETPKRGANTESTVLVDLPNENDQNQLNSFQSKTKTAKALTDAWKRKESPPQLRATPQRRLCVVASSVKNEETIRKFISRFKIEYGNKPTKDMTHLIVGLHESDEGEMLPLCTPKLLFAMANKKWVVSELWPETCLKMNSLLPEDSFETLDPIGGCACRTARLSGEKLLENYEIYLLGDFQMISKEDFAALLVDCGGTLVPTPEKFSFEPSKLRIIIADPDCLKLNEGQLQDLYQKHSTVILDRDFIIMSIQSFSLVNFTPYLLHSASEENLIKLGYPSPLVRNEKEEEDSDQDFAR